MRRVAGLLVLLVIAACGVPAQPSPEPVGIPTPSSTEPATTGTPDDPRVTLWFVRGTRLEAVERPAPGSDLGAVLELLVAGPDRGEVVQGLRTALSPQSLVPDRPASIDRVATVAVAREFTDVAGANQLLAVAQVVYTVTELPGIDAVRLTADGQQVDVPTDAGLTAEPVGRDDLTSVAPGAPTPDTDAPPPVPEGSPRTPSAPPPAPTAPSTPGRRSHGQLCRPVARPGLAPGTA